LKTRPPKDKLFAQVCSIEDFWKSFKYITAIFDQPRDQERKKP